MKTKLILGAVIVALLAGWLWSNNRNQYRLGQLSLRLASADSLAKVARHEADSLAGVYRVDTLRLTRRKTITDSFTVTVEKWKRDTLRVVEYVIRTDSTIAACTQALATCDARVAAIGKERDAVREANRILIASQPSKLSPWLRRVEGGVVGAFLALALKP